MTSKRIPVLYGTETGNAEYCADLLSEALQNQGFDAEPVDMGNYEGVQIADEEYVIIVTSTYGNGDPPSNARHVLTYLQERTEPLAHLKYAVCALGDRSYPYFAQCGKDFDKALQGLGAQPILARVDCDEDFEDDFSTFSESVAAYFATI